MTCKVTKDGDEIISIACGTSWGIGVYYHCHDRKCLCNGDAIYGFPSDDMNPNDFHPDEECSAQEIAAWQEAKKKWDERARIRHEDVCS